MKAFEPFYKKIDNQAHREKLENLFNNIHNDYPQLEPVIKWNQPMFTDHGTFIIGFSVAKQHFNVTPEPQVLDIFEKEIEAANYERKKMLFSIKWTQDIDYELIKTLIDFNIKDKAKTTTFWRK